MATQVGSIIRSATKRSDEKYNVLTYVTHERYQWSMRNTKADFYVWQNGVQAGQQDFVKGNWVQAYAEIPDNHQILPRWNSHPLEVVPSHIDIDIIMGQHRWGQAQQAIQIGKHLQSPTIVVEHTVPTSDAIRSQLSALREIRGDINVFISESSVDVWGWSVNDPSVRVIHHGVDTDVFSRNSVKYAIEQPAKEPHILCVVNDWVNRGDILGWDIFTRVCVNNKLPVRVLGDTKGVSQPAKNMYELSLAYQNASVFYNTSRHSPIPTVILEAMACELPVVTTDNYLISEVIINGYNGYKTNNEAEQLKHLQRLLLDEDERRELGKNARKTILEHFSLEKFTSAWNNVFETVGVKRES